MKRLVTLLFSCSFFFPLFLHWNGSAHFIRRASPQGFKVTTTSTNSLCHGDSNGTASVLATGSTGPYTYSWSDGVTGVKSRNDLPAGTIYVAITDTNTWSKWVSFTNEEPDALSATFYSTPGVGCMGTASASPLGGTPPYSHAWSNGQTSAFIFGLCDFIWYTDTITDANGCVLIDSVWCPPINGIDDELKSGIHSVSIYPNPAIQSFTLELEMDKSKLISIFVFNQNGKIILTRRSLGVTSYKETFDLGNVSPGIYLLQIQSSSGSLTRKLVVW